MKTTDKGRLTEQACCDYLREHGLELLDRNYRCRSGEVDLVMRDGDTLVFIEVRYRSSRRFGGAVASIDFRKRKRLMATALHYLQAKRLDCAARIDVVAMSPRDDGTYGYEWLQDAVREA